MPRNRTLSTVIYGLGNWELMFTKDQSYDEREIKVRKMKVEKMKMKCCQKMKAR